MILDTQEGYGAAVSEREAREEQAPSSEPAGGGSPKEVTGATPTGSRALTVGLSGYLRLRLRLGLGRGETGVTLVLSEGELLSFRVRRRPLRVVCLSGRVWATEERSGVDHLLGAGEERAFGCSGKVVLQALRASRVLVARSARIGVSWTLRPATQAG